MIRWYSAVRQEELTPDGWAQLAELLVMIELFLVERDVSSVDLRATASLDVVRGVASIHTLRALLDDFALDYLVEVVGANAPLLARYRSLVLDFRRWLCARYIHGPVLSAVV